MERGGSDPVTCRRRVYHSDFYHEISRLGSMHIPALFRLFESLDKAVVSSTPVQEAQVSLGRVIWTKAWCL